MKQDYGISGGALAAALLGMLFCIWTALGNEVAFCVTAGCSLYQDLVIGGLSMWWIGTAAFGVLACLALLGAVPAGHFLAGLTLLGDIFLLLLMALTSPCVSCLVVACFFALTYWLFRRALHRDDRRPQERSLLLCAWLVLFVVNAGYGGGFSTLPVLLEQHFGMSSVSTVHGLALSAWAFAGLSGNQLASFVVTHAADQSHRYAGLIPVLAVLYAVALVAILLVMRDRKSADERDVVNVAA